MQLEAYSKHCPPSAGSAAGTGTPTAAHALCSVSCFFAAVPSARTFLHCFAVHQLPFTGFLRVQSGLRHSFAGGTSDIAVAGGGAGGRGDRVTSRDARPSNGHP